MGLPALQVAGGAAAGTGISEAFGGEGGRKISDEFKAVTGTRAKKRKSSRIKRDREKAAKDLKRFTREQRDRREKIEKLFRNLADPKKTAGELRQEIKAVQGATGLQIGKTQADVDRLRDIARTEGPTALAQRLEGKQRAEQAARLEQLEEEQATRAAGAFQQLAQQGGAGAGARERLLAGAGSQALRESQRERRAGALARLGIASEDEARKLDLSQQAIRNQAQLAKMEAELGFRGAQAIQRAEQFDIQQQMQRERERARGIAGALGVQAQEEAKLFGTGQLADIQARQAEPSPGFFSSVFA